VFPLYHGLELPGRFAAVNGTFQCLGLLAPPNHIWMVNVNINKNINYHVRNVLHRKIINTNPAHCLPVNSCDISNTIDEVIK
jgi:hypothetical protein